MTTLCVVTHDASTPNLVTTVCVVTQDPDASRPLLGKGMGKRIP